MFRQYQKGSVLLEALVSVVIFSLGILALVSMQTAAVRSTTDAKYRADAAFLANQLIGQIWASDLANLGNFANGPVAAASAANCPTGGQVATSAVATQWLGQVAALLPGVDNNRQQISINGNVVTIRICWLDRSSSATAYHNHLVVAEINKN